MADALPSNRILRLLHERRELAHEAMLAVPSMERTADQIGVYYTAAVSRYNILNELYDEIAELLKQGDDLD